jgi:hypothetical protein
LFKREAVRWNKRILDGYKKKEAQRVEFEKWKKEHLPSPNEQPTPKPAAA